MTIFDLGLWFIQRHWKGEHTYAANKSTFLKNKSLSLVSVFKETTALQQKLSYFYFPTCNPLLLSEKQLDEKKRKQIFLCPPHLWLTSLPYCFIFWALLTSHFPLKSLLDCFGKLTAPSGEKTVLINKREKCPTDENNVKRNKDQLFYMKFFKYLDNICL